MRIARWMTAEGITREGFVVEDLVVPFAREETVASVLAGGLDAASTALAAAAMLPGTPLTAVQLLSPVVPAAVRDFVAFEEHVEGVSAAIDGNGHVADEWYEFPTFYFSNPHTVTGSGAVVVPPQTERLDFELEVAIVIGGAGGSDLDHAQAEAAIFGYTIMNDWSARDLQRREMQVRLGPAKGKDFALTLGPWIVTADELAPFLDDDGFLAIRAEAYVNGVLIGEDLVSNAGWPFPEFIMYASRASRIVAGDVLGSGTVGNGGCLAELWGRNSSVDPPPLSVGDEVRLVVEGIGELINTIGASRAPHAIPPARPRTRDRRRT